MKILALSILLISNAALAVMAFPGERTFQNKDGTSFTGYLKGDEWFNWAEDKQGHVIQYNTDSKNYEYSKIVQIDGKDELVPNGTSANDNAQNYSTSSSLENSEVSEVNEVSEQVLNTNIKLREIYKRYREEALNSFKTK